MGKVRKVINIIGIVWLLIFAGAAGWFFLIPHETILHSGSVSVDEDKYWAQRFRLEWDADVSITARVASGPPVDIYLMEPLELGKYSSGKSFKFMPSLSQGGARSFSKTSRLEPGEYVILVDNSDVGDTMPPMNMVNDIAVVELKIWARK